MLDSLSKTSGAVLSYRKKLSDKVYMIINKLKFADNVYLIINMFKFVGNICI